MTVKSDIEQELKKMINKHLSRWTAILISTLIILITGSTTAGVIALNNKEDIKEIREDYLSYSAFQYIVESNNKLMQLYAAIDSKDDKRYNQLMKEWNDLQQEVVKQAGLNKKRSGGSSNGTGGN